MNRSQPNRCESTPIPPSPSAEDSSPAPEDDPANWVYPHETQEEADLRQLVEEMTQLDDALSGILVDMATGAASKQQLTEQLDAWSTSMGGKPKQLAQPTQPPSPQPWLV